MEAIAEEHTAVFSTLSLAGIRPFQIACGQETTAETDPLAEAYKTGKPASLAQIVSLARPALQPGARVLDLGAHIGGFALAAAALGCDVFAIEASPRNAELLRLSACRNGFDNLTVLHAAVSSQPGEVAFSCHGPWGHLASSVTNLPSITVPAVRGDDVLAERGWTQVDFLKIDVEGSEVAAIEGMSRLLGAENAPLVVVEANRYTLGFYGKSPQDLWTALRQLGYTLYQVQPEKLALWPEGAQQAQVMEDYLAAKSLPLSLAAWPHPSAKSRLRRWLTARKQG